MLLNGNLKVRGSITNTNNNIIIYTLLIPMRWIHFYGLPLYSACLHVYCGGEIQSTQVDTARTCKLNTERLCPGWKPNWGPSRCEGTVLTTTSLRCQARKRDMFKDGWSVGDQLGFHWYPWQHRLKTCCTDWLQ